MTDYKEVRTTEHEQGKELRLATFKATQIIWLLLVLLEAGLALTGGLQIDRGQCE